MLVYRVIPDHVATTHDNGYLYLPSQTSEDAFYDLGYLNFSKAMRYYHLPSDPFMRRNVNSFQKSHELSKYFFLYPWDAMGTAKYLDEMYSTKLVGIFEYDIPENILQKYLGFGYYNGVKVAEFRVPLSEFQGEEPLIETYDEEFKKQLIERYRERVKESLLALKSILEESSIEKMQNHTRNLLDGSDSYDLLEKTKFQKLGTSLPSKMITGRSFLVTRHDVVQNLYFAEKIPNLIELSKGILSSDNYSEWEDYQHQDGFENSYIRKKYFSL